MIYLPDTNAWIAFFAGRTAPWSSGSCKPTPRTFAFAPSSSASYSMACITARRPIRLTMRVFLLN